MQHRKERSHCGSGPSGRWNASAGFRVPLTALHPSATVPAFLCVAHRDALAVAHQLPVDGCIEGIALCRLRSMTEPACSDRVWTAQDPSSRAIDVRRMLRTLRAAQRRATWPRPIAMGFLLWDDGSLCDPSLRALTADTCFRDRDTLFQRFCALFPATRRCWSIPTIPFAELNMRCAEHSES